MDTFRDLLRIVAISCGETVVIRPLSIENNQQYDIRSEPFRPKGCLTRNTTEVLRFRFHRGKVRLRIPGHLRWYTFALDDHIIELARIKPLSTGVISALLKYRSQPNPSADDWVNYIENSRW